MKLFMQYLKFHRKSVFMFFCFGIIFSVVQLAFDVPIKVILYGYVVCFFVGLSLTFLDFSKYCDKHNHLEHLVSEIRDTMDNLPVPCDLLEEDYQNIIVASFKDKMDFLYDSNRRYEEMADYYTMWAHQIKTPIAALRLILQTEEIPSKREISDELLKIEQYVEMVLCYIRLDSHSTDYVIKQYDIDEIIKQAVRKYAGQFIRSKNTLVYGQVCQKVNTDEKWLVFVIEQVLSNSLKYTRNGQIEILWDSPNTLVIRDSGMGIAKEDLPRIFEKGFTGYNGREDKKSTGIGLYLCKRICENLGHEIKAASEVGKGTVIRISFSEYRITGE